MTPRIFALVVTCLAPNLAPTGLAAQGLPDYFYDEIVASSWAEQVAKFCPSLSINPISAEILSEALLVRLSKDGIDTAIIEADAGSDAIQARQRLFVEKYGLVAPTQAEICAAGRAEIAEGTAIGAYMTEVSQ